MRLAAALVALAFMSGHALAQQTVENTRHGYTLEIPEEWHEVPSEFLTEFSRSVSSPEQTINYVEAYQKEPFDGALVYPYILIQSIPYRDFGLDAPPTSLEMAAVVESIVGMDIVDAVSNSLAPDITELIEGKPSIRRLSFDGLAGEFVYDVDLAVANVGNIRGRARGVFGRRAMLQPAYFALEPEWAESESEVNSVLNSFAFTPDYAYPADAASSQDDFEVYQVEVVRYPPLTNWALAAGGVLAVILIAIALALAMLAIDRRK